MPRACKAKTLSSKPLRRACLGMSRGPKLPLLSRGMSRRSEHSPVKTVLPLAPLRWFCGRCGFAAPGAYHIHPRWWLSSAPSARSISAFLNAIDTVFTALALAPSQLLTCTITVRCHICVRCSVLRYESNLMQHALSDIALGYSRGAP